MTTQTLDAGRLRGLQASILDVRDDAPLAPPPIEQERALHHQERVGRIRRFDILRARAAGPIGGPVDAIDDRRLRGARRGRKGEVGVAAGFEQDRNLVIDAAMPAVGPGVAQRPVAVDEAEHHRAALTIARQQAVAIGQNFLGFEQARPQVLRRVVSWCRWISTSPKPARHSCRQRVEIFRLVIFDGVEEGVARRPAVAVAKAAELPRILLDPGGDAGPAGFQVRLARRRLEMIANAQENVNFLVGAGRLEAGASRR